MVLDIRQNMSLAGNMFFCLRWTLDQTKLLSIQSFDVWIWNDASSEWLIPFQNQTSR